MPNISMKWLRYQRVISPKIQVGNTNQRKKWANTDPQIYQRWDQVPRRSNHESLSKIVYICSSFDMNYSCLVVHAPQATIFRCDAWTTQTTLAFFSLLILPWLLSPVSWDVWFTFSSTRASLQSQLLWAKCCWIVSLWVYVTSIANVHWLAHISHLF
jgi:hypothetical protein